MSAEEMASRELKEWRQAELKHDIEKIKSHELEMISLGSVYVMKSHKGEQVRATPKDFLRLALSLELILLRSGTLCHNCSLEIIQFNICHMINNTIRITRR